MTEAKRKSNNPSGTTKSLTIDLGRIPTLPGESEEEFEKGLQSLTDELEAKTAMQIYLAEKIFECLWWMRRYEQQKRTTLVFEMISILYKSKFLKPIDDADLERILDPSSQAEFGELLAQVESKEQVLMHKAFENKSENIEAYNKQINMLAKTLSGFQASYEVLTNRKLHIERLQLQNKLLEKDLHAIDIKALPDASQSEKKSS